MSKKKGTNNKKNAKAQEKVQNLEQNEVVEKDINKPNETKTSDNESTKVSKEAKKVDVAKADKKAKKDTKTKKHFFKDFKAELKKVIWPTPKQLANNTFAVIVVVLIIAVVVFVLDFAFENINANEVPMDGSMAFFPKQDMSEIYVKGWNADGTINTIVYKPYTAPKDNQTVNSMSNAENAKFTLSDESTQLFLNKFEELSEKIGQLEDRFDKSLGTQRKASRTQSKGGDEE